MLEFYESRTYVLRVKHTLNDLVVVKTVTHYLTRLILYLPTYLVNVPVVMDKRECTSYMRILLKLIIKSFHVYLRVLRYLFYVATQN